MNGNVWEWVADRYAPFTTESQTDPAGPPSGDERVIRGGGFDSELRLCRSANRFSYPPAVRYPNVGFRAAATLSLPAEAP
jgi:formylglycine-generating enzyme required for sulfatase activity